MKRFLLLFLIASFSLEATVYRIIASGRYGWIIIERTVGKMPKPPFCYTTKWELEQWRNEQWSDIQKQYEKDTLRASSDPKMKSFYEEKRDSRIERLLDHYEAAYKRLRNKKTKPQGL